MDRVREKDQLQMAGICCPNLIPHVNRITAQSPPYLQRVYGGVRCCSLVPDNNNIKTKTSPLLRLAVTGVTELLRLFSSSTNDRVDDELNTRDRDRISISDVDDVLRILKADYENAYFVTGNFSSEIYAEDCMFEDPTIRFRGKELYSRNLKLLVPFFDSPSISLKKIEKVSLPWIPLEVSVKNMSQEGIVLLFSQGANMETNFVLATWRLSTYLKLPWRPLISIDGSTFYELNEQFMIVRHAESWNVSALEAIGQICTYSSRMTNN